MRAFLFEHVEITDCHLMYSYGTRTLVYGIEPKVSRLKSYFVSVTDRVTCVIGMFRSQRLPAFAYKASLSSHWASVKVWWEEAHMKTVDLIKRSLTGVVALGAAAVLALGMSAPAVSAFAEDAPATDQATALMQNQ